MPENTAGVVFFRGTGSVRVVLFNESTTSKGGIPMDKLGTVAGVLGILICICAIAGRFIGNPMVFHSEASTILLLGATSVVIGSFLKTFKK